MILLAFCFLITDNAFEIKYFSSRNKKKIEVYAKGNVLNSLKVD